MDARFWQNGRDGDRYEPTAGVERFDGTGYRAVNISVVCVVTYEKSARMVRLETR